MIPILFKIGPLTIYSYGLMVAVAVMLCSFLLSREAKSIGIKSDVIFDLVFCLVISGILGARLFFILLNLPFFIQNPLETIMIQNGGLAWQGSLIVGSISSIFFIRKKKLPLLKTLDLFMPYVALGQAIGRVGCFLNGCCFGKQVSWGIYFPVHDAHLHPTQLYLTTGFFIIFILLKIYQKKASIPGQVFILYLLLAPIWRFIVEFFRADHIELWLGLSIFQFVCLGIMGVALYGYSSFKNSVKA